MAKPILEIEGLQAGYGDVQVLWDIGLSVNEGEIACVVGSNGAGKTTLLRTISGLIEPKAGSIVFDGEEIAGARPDEVLTRGIAHVPEGRRLFKGLTVEDNLLLGAYLRRDKGAVREDMEFVFDLFPILKERRLQDATTMSGGEQQMCAIGRALMSRPTTILLDEPSMGLAPQLVEEIFEIVSNLNTKEGVTFLLAEQNTNIALRYATYGYILESGRVVMDGEAKDLRENEDVREFYLGIGGEGRKSFRDVKHYKRRKRWLA